MGAPLQLAAGRAFLRAPGRAFLLSAARAFLLSAGTLGLQACAPLAARPDAPPAAFAPPVRAFAVNGRLAARHGAEGVSANFRWRHDGEQDMLELVSPLGQTIARMSGGAGHVELERSDGRREVAESWDALTQRGLGWTLPVGGLASWIQGSPRPGSKSTTENETDTAVLRQDGWTIVYNAAIDTEGGRRPSRLTLTYPDIEVRLAVDDWQ
jgi:outer membrane lipoprotein LolB